MSPSAMPPAEAETDAIVWDVGEILVWLREFRGACSGTRSGQDPISRRRVLRVLESDVRQACTDRDAASRRYVAAAEREASAEGEPADVVERLKTERIAAEDEMRSAEARLRDTRARHPRKA